MSRVRKKNLTVPVNSPSDILIQKDEDYARAQRAALALLKRGFHLGGKNYISRDELHERHSSGHPPSSDQTR
jgi:hypothetical protein